MKFLNKIKAKKNMKDYKDLLEFKEELDSISLKISILNDRLNSYRKITSLSFDKMNDYINKIYISKEKNNIDLCKRGFFKYYKETLIYNNLTKFDLEISNEFNLLNEQLIALQEIYTTLEDDFNKDITSSKFSLKNIFSNSIPDFFKKTSEIESIIIKIQEKLPKNFDTNYMIKDSDVFSNKENFEIEFNNFLKKHCLNFT